MNLKIEYRKGFCFTLEQARQVYAQSTLAERRPVQNEAVFNAMFQNADLLISAWDGETLVGISRTLTDFAYVAYLADLAVAQSHQGQGIGTELIHQTRAALDPTCFLTLLSAPKANEFYPKIGFQHHPRAWVWPAEVDPLSKTA